jgi:hypothetical protein
MAKESRKTLRFPVNGTVQVSWQNAHGGLNLERARFVNSSEGGLAVETQQPVPVGSRVMLQEARHGRAWAQVRYCRSVKLRYVVGLEMMEGALAARLIAGLESLASR